MTWLKIFVVIAFVFINWCVLAFEPSVHAPFVMEKKDFKLAKHYQEPKSSSGTINLLKLGLSKIPPAQEANATLADASAEQTVKREVHIEPSEFYRQANGLGIRNVSNTRSENFSFGKNKEKNKRLEQKVDAVISATEEKPKKLSRREETIAWNRWRSDLQNRIMAESPVNAPIGTFITFSFRVSSKKTISNVKVNCSNWSYTKSIREVMVPLIKSYAGKEFLEFPAGSERKFIDFKGAFLIWYEESFSSPDDYNDFERVQWYE